jgi:hypothetical protein
MTEIDLKVLRLSKYKYESYQLPFRAQVINDVFVDDLRSDDDESLNLVPRITTFAQLKETFKLDVNHSLPKVLAENDQPVPPPGAFVFAHWPGAPSMDTNPNYHSNAVGGFTNVNGDVGFGYSGGAVTGGDGGVYDIWVSADPPSGT